MHAGTTTDSRHPGIAAAAHPATAVVASNDDSAVSWAAILAGAAAAAALSLILVLLGVGLGLSSVSPWAFEGIDAETFGWATIAWITFTSLAASGLGGYLAGRLRRRWVAVRDDETYFRDTAHGFLSWAVATLLTAALLTSAIAGMLGAGAKLAGAATGGVAAAGQTLIGGNDANGSGLIDYYVDRLFRASDGASGRSSRMEFDERDPNSPMTSPTTASARSPASDRQSRSMVVAEAGRIIAISRDNDELAPDDARYLATLVAQHTGLSQQEAEARVADLHGRLSTVMSEADTAARAAADEAREASAYAALWLFITLLIGAFFASLFATFGGRQRDLD